MKVLPAIFIVIFFMVQKYEKITFARQKLMVNAKKVG